MTGDAFKRCWCRDEAGKRLGPDCPRLTDRQHGGWYYRYSEPTGVPGRRRQPIAGPFPTKKAAEADRIERLSQLNGGLHSLARMRRVHAVIHAYLADRVARDMIPATRPRTSASAAPARPRHWSGRHNGWNGGRRRGSARAR